MLYSKQWGGGAKNWMNPDVRTTHSHVITNGKNMDKMKNIEWEQERRYLRSDEEKLCNASPGWRKGRAWLDEKCEESSLQYRPRLGSDLKEIGIHQQREVQRSKFDLASLPAALSLPQSVLTTQIHLALAGSESATGMAVLSCNLLPHQCSKRKDKALAACFTEQVDSEAKEAAKRPSCLKNLQQEELQVVQKRAINTTIFPLSPTLPPPNLPIHSPLAAWNAVHAN